MLKFALGLILALTLATVVKAESQLKPFDVLWHCDRVTNSVSEMADEIGQSVRKNGESYTDETYANTVFTMVKTREFMTLRRMEYDRTPETPFYSAVLYDRMINSYKGYVVDMRKEFAKVNPAIIGTHVFRSCVNENLAVKNNP